MNIKIAPRNSYNHPPTVHVIGGGISGLLIGMDVIAISKALDLPTTVRIYEASAFGGGTDDRVATSRCQLWLHTDGQLFALGQPSVCRALQRSTRRLYRLAPYAFSSPPALVIDPHKSVRASLGAYYQAADVPHRRIDTAVVRHWFPSFQLHPDDRVYAVADATMDLPLLAHAAARCAHKKGITLIQAQMKRLILHGGVVRAMIDSTGLSTVVGPDDHIVLACGANIRPLLARSDLHIPGLRHFKSHLVATDTIGLDLLAVEYGQSNCVPHRAHDGTLVNIFGDTYRTEVLAEEDERPLTLDNAAVAHIRQAVWDRFGLHIPMSSHAWPAIKTELISDEKGRSQSHHTQLVPGLENCWLALPGKLSQAAAMSWDLARLILRTRIGSSVAHSIWEQPHTELAQNVSALRIG